MMKFPTFAASMMVYLSFLSTGGEAFTARSSLSQRQVVPFSAGLNNAPMEEDLPPLSEVTFSSPEEMEEYLDKLAAKLREEIPDDPIEDKMALYQSWAGDYDKEAARKRIQKQIDEHDVLMFGFTTCQYTIEAKEIFKDLDVKVMARDFDTLPTEDGYALRAELATMLDRPEVPAIFIKGEFIGGVNDGPGLKAIIAEGKLKEMLEG